MFFSTLLLSLTSTVLAQIYAISRDGEKISVTKCTSNRLLEQRLSGKQIIGWDLSTANLYEMRCMPVGFYERFKSDSLMSLPKDFPVVDWLNGCSDRILDTIYEKTKFFQLDFQPSVEQFDSLNHLVRGYLDVYSIIKFLSVDKESISELLGLRDDRARQKRGQTIINLFLKLSQSAPESYAFRALEVAKEVDRMKLEGHFLKSTQRQLKLFKIRAKQAQVAQAQDHGEQAQQPEVLAAQVAQVQNAQVAPQETDAPVAQQDEQEDIMDDVDYELSLEPYYEVPVQPIRTFHMPPPPIRRAVPIEWLFGEVKEVTDLDHVYDPDMQSDDDFDVDDYINY